MNHSNQAIHARIVKCLQRIEHENAVRIMYACESGSRAWGFHSADSDYDVRFIYARPESWYLSIDLERHRDVIELPIEDELDINGWDVRKALRLFRKSNPPLMEWVHSPIVYVDREEFGGKLRQLAEVSYNLVSARYHYFHMAKNNFREYLRGQEVIRKKYLYVLRPLLAVCWIEQDLGVVPTEFSSLVEATVRSASLLDEINELLRLKRAGSELDRGKPFPLIQQFIESELERLEHAPRLRERPAGDLEALNRLFRETVGEIRS